MPRYGLKNPGCHGTGYKDKVVKALIFHYTVGSSKILTVNNTAIKYLSLATVVFFAPQNDEPVRMPREKAKSKEVRFKID